MEINETLVLALFGLAIIVVLILAAVVYYQNQKIKDLTTPKYGFLGKPLSIFLLSALVFGSFGLYIGNRTKEPDSVSVTDQGVVTFEVQYDTINAAARVYRFRAVPQIDGIEFGINPNRTFDVNWTIVNQTTFKTTEFGLNRNFQGGLNLTLRPGINRIRAEVIVNEKLYSDEITLEIR